MIIVTGTIAYDYIMDFPGSFGDHILPHQIHKINLSFNVNKFARRRGGTAGNVSYSLALLKTPHILFSVAGKDFSAYKKHFKKLGINISNVLIDKSEYSSTGFAMTDKNDNQIWGFFPGAAEKIKDLKLKEVVARSHFKTSQLRHSGNSERSVEASRISEAARDSGQARMTIAEMTSSRNDLVLIGPSGARGSISLVRQCVDLGIPYMFDPGFILTQVNNRDLEFGAAHCSYLVGSDYEINLIKKRIKEWRKLFRNKAIVTTLGNRGSAIESKGTVYKIKSAKPKKVVDPTGAGDAYRAGFLAGLERGFAIKICGQMGSVVASFAVEEYGTQEHRFTIKDFRDRYRQTYNAVLEL